VLLAASRADWTRSCLSWRKRRSTEKGFLLFRLLGPWLDLFVGLRARDWFAGEVGSLRILEFRVKRKKEREERNQS